MGEMGEKLGGNTRKIILNQNQINMTNQIRTIEPDFRYTDFEQWKRYISREVFHATNKVTMIKIFELTNPRLKVN
jgi:hypothetical protein